MTRMEQVVDVVAGVAGAWLRNEWPEQAGLVAKIAAGSGFSTEVVATGTIYWANYVVGDTGDRVNGVMVTYDFP